MKRLLITGASGFLGWNVCRLAAKQWKVFGVTFSHSVTIPEVSSFNVDLTNIKALKCLLQEVQPDAIIHTAAASKLNYCQTHRTESYKINVTVPTNIAGLCADRGIPLVFTSTDNVFDGLNPPYGEQAPVCPLNIYGEQKVLAEQEMTRCYPEVMICRMAPMFGNSYPGLPSSFQQLLKSMKAGQKVRVFADEYRSFLSVNSACLGLFVALNNTNGILHLAGNESVSRHDFVRLIAHIFQIGDAKLISCSSKDVPMIAPRPLDVSLDNSKARTLGVAPLSLQEELSLLCS